MAAAEEEEEEFNEEPPSHFTCPISQSLMREPVVCLCGPECGNSYDAHSLELHFQYGNGLCPKTSKPISRGRLARNRNLQQSVEQWAEQHRQQPQAAPPSAAPSAAARLLSGDQGSASAAGPTPAPVADGQWHHLAIVQDPRGGWSRLYLDGASADSLRIAARTDTAQPLQSLIEALSSPNAE